ncbi:MAG: alpha-N-arabinofuranosidase [Capsulimonadales bacterium]|nr:alpha-N-arabinofuranosidase [Capsulimonadales bacterium]
MAEATLTVLADGAGPTIHPNIYGHFAEHLGRCIYEGFWVGEDSPIPNTRGIRNDVVSALKQLNLPVLRWPGGCFADEYHWKDGVGPREKRPSMINTHWGGVVENNHFGTHEFLDLCEQIGTEPYICGNVGSGTPQEMMEWVEYLTSDADTPMTRWRKENGREHPWKITYFGVGNESWGCGGNMRPAFYADNYRRYNTFVKNYGGNRLFRIACGPNVDDYRWTETLMEIVGGQMNGLSLHYYTTPTPDWNRKGPATGFDEAHWHSTLRRALHMDTLIARHSEIMNRFDPQKKIGLIVDEWGTWYDVEPGTNPGFLYQQNTLRDALVAALHFHIFHAHADRVVMANIAQTINVLQAMILTDKERMLLTPTYHLFEMYRAHQGATTVPVFVDSPDYTFGDASLPQVSASASRGGDGQVRLSLVNTHPSAPLTVHLRLSDGSDRTLTGRVLTGDAIDAHNTFDAPETVRPSDFEPVTVSSGSATLLLPAKSVVLIRG